MPEIVRIECGEVCKRAECRKNKARGTIPENSPVDTLSGRKSGRLSLFSETNKFFRKNLPILLTNARKKFII